MTRKDSVRRGALARWIASLIAPLAVLVLVAPAGATPTGEFANFADCPIHNSEAGGCLFAQSTSGEFDIGSTAVPITKTITLQGGLTVEQGGFSQILPAADGNTLSKSPQTVPGGLFKIVAPESWPGWLRAIFNEFINKGLTGVTASTELVGTPQISVGKAFAGSGTALELPVRVHLENPFLGGSCYVGSKSHPVTVDFTTGTTNPPPPNEPITGSLGKLEFRGSGQIIAISENKLVNNTFAAPEAQGCGGIFSFLVDPSVDAEIGLPSAAGHNTAILQGSQELTSVSAVVKNEEEG